MATASAGARVAGTTELLEAILLYLNHDEIDLKTLLVSQRTSTTFRNTIRGSLKLRQALYLEPPTALRADNELRSGMNPLLQLDIPEFDNMQSYTSPYSNWKLSLPRNSQHEFHISIRETSSGALYSLDSTILGPTIKPSQPSPSALTAVPSWTKMYVFQWRVNVECRNKRERVCHFHTNPTFDDIIHRYGVHCAPSRSLQSMEWTFQTQ